MFALGLTLRPATFEDRPAIHAWMTAPGIVESMLGPPLFPDVLVPSLEQFVADWEPHHFTHEALELGRMFVIERDGRAVGVIAQNTVVNSAEGERCAEIDLWLASVEARGRGYGSTALSLLAARLEHELGLDSIFLQPSARNPNAIRAYLDAGFRPVPNTTAETARRFATTPDYHDSVFLEKKLRGHARLARVPSDLDRALVMPALSLADDSERAVLDYRDQGRLYALLGEGAAPSVVGHVLVTLDAARGEAEFVNLALLETVRGHGLGSGMLRELLQRLARLGSPCVRVATATADTQLLHFYQRLGFRFRSVERDVFTPEHGYPADLSVRGVRILDRVWLDRDSIAHS
jgi:RimJ/RimL family protein N-acetyltransferase